MVTARGTHGRRSFTRPRRRLAVAIALGCCAPALACTPTAAAWPPHAQDPGSHEQRGAEAPAQPGAGGHEQRAEPHAQQGTGNHEQRGAEAPAQPGARGHEQQDPGNHEQRDAEAHTQPDAKGHARQNTGSRESPRAEPHAQQDPGNHEQHDAEAHTQPDAKGHAQQDPGNHEQRAEPHAQQGTGNHARQDAAGSPSQATPSSAVSGASTATPVPLLGTAALVPSSTTTPTATTPPPQSQSVSRPSGSGRSHHAPRRIRHVRRRTTGRGRAQTGLASSPRALAPAAALPAAGRATQTARAGRATHSSPRHGRTSPLVRTITRIVGVVPVPLRILVGFLLALALALAVRSRVAALRARRLERQRTQLLEDVGLLQAALLPVPPPRLGPVGTSAAYRPADGPGAGGDFYDVFALEDGRLAVIVGDVSGHGRQALPHTALVRFTLRAYLEAGLSPRVAVQTAGAVLDRQLGESFATVVAATYNPRERTLRYACAGHPPPLVIGSRSRPLVETGMRAEGECLPASVDQPGWVGSTSSVNAIAPITVCSAPPIGAGLRTGTRQTVVAVPDRSLACFYTDGLTEARVGPELFGAERLQRALAELGSQATASALLDRVVEATDARPDDMAACLLGISGPAGVGGVGGAPTPGAPRVLVEELELDCEAAASGRTEQFLLACGVERREIAELLRSARAAAGQAGTVILELRLGDGAPQVTLRRENVARLHTPPARPRQAAVGASR